MKFPLASRLNQTPTSSTPVETDRATARSPWRSRLNPSRWSVTAKITASMLALAVLPASLVAFYNLNRGVESIRTTELNNLKLLAISSSSRLDQLIIDTRRVVEQMSNNQDIINFLATKPQKRAEYEAAVTLALENFRLSSDDYELTYLLDVDANMVAIPAFPDALGKNYAFREYYRVPKEQGKSYASTILLGTTTDEPGLYFSAPVYDDTAELVGIAVLKMNGETVWELVDDVQVGDAEGGNANNDLTADSGDAATALTETNPPTTQAGFRSGAALVDKYGIIIAHPNRDYLYRSVDELSPELLEQVERDRARVNQAGSRLYGREVESLDMPELAAVVVNPEAPGEIEPGAVEYFFPTEGSTKVAGYAPLENQSWVMVVFEPEELFQAPLERLRTQNLLTVVVVGGVAATIALLIARSIVNPLRVLTESARRMEANEFNPQLIAKTEQVLNQLRQERRIRRLFTLDETHPPTALTQPALVRLKSAQEEIPDCQLIAIVDQQGKCCLATATEFIGQSFQLEPYFRQALQNKTVVGERNSKPKQAEQEGLYFAAPITIPEQVLPVGVVIIVLKQTALYLADLLETADRPDDLGQLADVFMRMASQVKVREERLKQQVTELKIEIDQSKKAKQVAEITESDYFQSLQAKAKVFRERSHAAESSESPSTPH